MFPAVVVLSVALPLLIVVVVAAVGLRILQQRRHTQRNIELLWQREFDRVQAIELKEASESGTTEQKPRVLEGAERYREYGRSRAFSNL